VHRDAARKCRHALLQQQLELVASFWILCCWEWRLVTEGARQIHLHGSSVLVAEDRCGARYNPLQWSSQGPPKGGGGDGLSIGLSLTSVAVTPRCNGCS
jgi:hypothetical protein